MAAPTSAQIKTALYTALPMNFKSGGARTEYPQFFAPNGLTTAQDDFLSQFAGDLASTWAAWASALTFGGATVVGLGIGAWAGVGSGGAFLANPLGFAAQNPLGFSPQPMNTVFRSALSAGINAQFADLLVKFTLVSVPYIGTSSATPLSPGVFLATNTTTTLLAASSGVVYMAAATISATIRANLVGFVGVGLDPTYYNAIGDAMYSLMQTFLSTSTLNANTVTGVALAGAGTGTSISLPNGVVV